MSSLAMVSWICIILGFATAAIILADEIATLN